MASSAAEADEASPPRAALLPNSPPDMGPSRATARARVDDVKRKRNGAPETREADSARALES